MTWSPQRIKASAAWQNITSTDMSVPEVKCGLPTPAPAFNSPAVTARSEPRYRPSLAA